MVDQRAPSVDDVVDKDARIRKLGEDVKNRDDQIAEFELHIQAQENSIAELETNVETKDEKIAGLEDRITNYETDVKGMQHLNSELKAKYEISERDLAAARKEQRDIDELRGLIEDHQAESARRGVTIDHLKNERDNSVSEVAHLQSDVRDFISQAETLESNYDIIKQENDELRGIYDVLEKHFPGAEVTDADRIDELIQDLKFESGLPLSPKKRDRTEKRQPSLADELAALSEDEELSPEMKSEFGSPTEQRKESSFKFSDVFEVSNIEPVSVSPEAAGVETKKTALDFSKIFETANVEPVSISPDATGTEAKRTQLGFSRIFENANVEPESISPAGADTEAKKTALEFSKIFEHANVEPESVSPDATNIEAKNPQLDFSRIYETANVEPESVSPRTIVSSSTKAKEATPLRFSRISEIVSMEPESISPRTIVSSGKTEDNVPLGLSQVYELVNVEPEEAISSTAVEDRKRKPAPFRFSKISALSTQDGKPVASRRGVSNTSESKPVQPEKQILVRRTLKKPGVQPPPPRPSPNPVKSTTSPTSQSRPTRESPQWQYRIPKLLMFFLSFLTALFFSLLLLLTGFYFGDYPWSYANGYTDAAPIVYITGGIFGGVFRAVGNAVFEFLKPQLEIWAREAYVGGLPG